MKLPQIPIVLRSDYDALKTENFMLRDALRNANEELRKYRALVNGLRTGLPETMAAFERTLKKAKARRG